MNAPQAVCTLRPRTLSWRSSTGTGASFRPGEAGEIVITHLATSDFPFIRYRTGDVAALDDRRCPCGRGLPLLKDIQGRTTDFVVAQDGTVMHGLALIYVLRETPGIASFKIVQESLDRTRVLLVPGAGYGEPARRRIERRPQGPARQGCQSRARGGAAHRRRAIRQVPLRGQRGRGALMAAPLQPGFDHR